MRIFSAAVAKPSLSHTGTECIRQNKNKQATVCRQQKQRLLKRRQGRLLPGNTAITDMKGSGILIFC
jgi:hypothetical protein